jgi:integrase
VLDEIRCVPCQTLKEHAPEECEACDRWRIFFAFLAHTGLRIGEAIALQWEHVDLGASRVRVRRRFYRDSFAPPKSRYGRRDVPLSPGTGQALWRLRDGAGDEELVFRSEKGGPLDASNVAARILKPAARRAGAPWASFHTFRHTCATTLFRNGMNPKQVQVWLGHHSPGFTLATYVHLIADDLPDASFLDGITSTDGDKQGNDGATGAPETPGTLTVLDGTANAVEAPCVSGLRPAASSS